MPKVDYDIFINHSPGSVRKMDELIGKAKQLKTELKEAGQAAAGGYDAPGGVKPFRRTPGGAAPGRQAYSMGEYFQESIISRQVLPSLTAVLALHVGEAAMRGATKALRVMNDPYSSNYSQNRAAKEGLPLGLGTASTAWLDFLDEVGTWGIRFREIARKASLAMAELATGVHEQQAGLAINQRISAARGRTDAATQALISSMSPVMGAFLNTSDPRFQGLRQGFGGVIDAQRGLDQALGSERFARQEYEQAMGEAETYVGLSAKYSRNMKGMKDPTTGEEQLEADRKRAEYAQLLAETHEKIERALRAEKELAAAAGEVEKARNDVSQAGLNISQEKMRLFQSERDTLKAGAIQFGMMRPVEQGAAIRAAERMKQFGPRVLTDRERGLISRAGLFDKITEEASLQAARQSPYFDQALKVGRLRGFGEIDQSIQDVKIELDVRFTNIAEAAREFENKIVPAAKEAMGLERKKSEIERAARENEQFQRKALSPSAGK